MTPSTYCKSILCFTGRLESNVPHFCIKFQLFSKPLYFDVEIRVLETFSQTAGILLVTTDYYYLSQSKGFDISYLAKVPEVKDTVHKQTLLHHLCSCVLEKFPDSTDLYSEFGALTRCSRVSGI